MFFTAYTNVTLSALFLVWMATPRTRNTKHAHLQLCDITQYIAYRHFQSLLILSLLSMVIYPKSLAHEVVYFSATYLKNGGVAVLKKTLSVLDFNFQLYL